MRFLSLFSGIDAASVAWQPLGWKAAGFAEIEAFPSAVLAHRYPDVPNLGDVTKADFDAIGPIDLLVGGSPCQSFSVAGKRLGLDDARGNLALVYGQVVYRKRPRWFVYENVPGLLSSESGWDFGTLLAAFSGQPPGSVFEPPEGGWRNSGVVREAKGGYGLAWRVLDAQYCRTHGFARGVPQRRRRVFVVGHLGDWRRAAAVLFERESLCGNPPPRREAGKGTAGTLAARAGGGGWPDGGDGRHDQLVAVPARAATLTRGAESSGKGGYAGRRQEDDENLVASVAQTLDASYGEKWGLDDQHINNGGSLFVVHALRADGFDASEDGTGRGTPLTVCFDETQITSKDNRNQPRAGETDHPLAAGARPPTIAFHARQDPDTGPVTHPLDTDGTSVGVFTNWRVRRLTPTECERLQGFPDGYTNVSYRGKPASDGPRYKALGNSMAVNCMRWIGQRIQAVENSCASIRKD